MCNQNYLVEADLEKANEKIKELQEIIDLYEGMKEGVEIRITDLEYDNRQLEKKIEELQKRLANAES